MFARTHAGTGMHTIWRRRTSSCSTLACSSPTARRGASVTAKCHSVSRCRAPPSSPLQHLGDRENRHLRRVSAAACERWRAGYGSVHMHPFRSSVFVLTICQTSFERKKSLGILAESSPVTCAAVSSWAVSASSYIILTGVECVLYSSILC